MCLQLETNQDRAAPAAKPAPRARRARASRVAAPTPVYRTNAEVAALVASFEDATLPRAEWTHDAHLVVALAYARHARPGEALARLRESIRRYNGATGTPETPTRGYHETITRAWFHLVVHFLEVFDDGRSIAALVDALLELYGSKDALFEHYTRERLLSPGARAGWVGPDRRPLPELAPLTREDQAWLEALEARVPAGTARAAVAGRELVAA